MVYFGKIKEGVKMRFVTFDKKELNLEVWENVENPVGVVQIVHGMVEYAKRYETFAAFLNSKGYVVVADDHRGHGDTDPDTLGYCQKDMFKDTVRDEGCITEYFKKKYEGLPYFVLGFSYGSFLTQQYISEYGDRITGAIIAGSNYKKDGEVSMGYFVAGLGIFFGRAKKPAKLIKNLSFGAYEKKFDDREWLSTDAENNAKYHADKYCSFVCSNRFYRDFFRGLKALYTKKYISGLKKDLPLLLVSGKDDPVGDQGKGVQKLYDFYTKKAGMTEVNMVLFENSRHEFLNEKENREEKWGAVLDFLQKHTK